MSSKISVGDFNAFVEQAFEGERTRPEAVEFGDGSARVRLAFHSSFLRPGGVISGPTQMSLADTATYAAIFTKIGITPMAVTSSLNMSFLRPCLAEEVIAVCEILKFGRKLAVGEVTIGGVSQMSEGKPASHAIVTYVLPDNPV